MYPCMYVGSRGENLSSDCTLGLSGGWCCFCFLADSCLQPCKASCV
jgi:hypothetical protein